MLAPQGALYTIVLGWTQLFCDYHSFQQQCRNTYKMIVAAQDLCGRLHGGRINGDIK